MAVGQERTERGLRSSLGLWASSKAVEGNEQGVRASTTTNGSTSDTIALQQPRKDKIGSRLRRNSSRFLSRFRRRRGSSNAAKASSAEPGTPLALETVADVSQYSCPATATDKVTCQNTDSHSQENPQKYTLDDARKPSMVHVERSQSNSNLTALLSRRLSTTFSNSTVIHRSNMHPRPSIRAVQIPQDVDVRRLGNQGDSTADSYTPSTTPSSGSCWSSGPNSTLPTSNDSPTSENSRPLLWNTNRDNENLSQLDHESRKFDSIQQSLNISPSIVTVESAANAKVFFETYFNAIFSRVDARSQRENELEQYLYSLPFTPEEQVVIRNNWIGQEREYLRQCRALKRHCHRARRGEAAASVANYEVVKVLGKGSFGVVRLVREKGNECSRCDAEEDDSSLLDKAAMADANTKAVDIRKSPIMDETRSNSRKHTSDTKPVYAMKVVRKSKMLRTNQEGHLRAERDFLVASAKSRWVVPLIASFQDRHNLYLVMEHMIGGDFLGLLIRQGILPERATRWYLAEMVLCIEEAHKLFWIHRDIKPDNFLISASGHLRIADFGLAFDGHWAHDQGYYNDHRYSLVKKLGIQIDGDAVDRKEEEKAKQEVLKAPGWRKMAAANELMDEPPTVGLLGWRDKYQKRSLARSVVGTSQYMAPEVVRGKSYDGRCDWWSIGIILYECLYGFTPFASEDRLKTKIKILNHHQILHFPAQRLSDRLVSTSAIDLIGQLLQEKEYRLSARSYRLNDPASRSLFQNTYRDHRGPYVCPNDASYIKAHPFFREVKWDSVHQSRPPLVPSVQNWEDTSYFDDAGYTIDGGNISNLSETNDAHDGFGDKASPETPPQTAETGSGGTKVEVQSNKTPSEAKAQMKKKRAKEERARDKILRDGRVNKTVMNMRKKDAFLGYTYRPKPVAFALETERGRPLLSRKHLSDLYGC